MEIETLGNIANFLLILVKLQEWDFIHTLCKFSSNNKSRHKSECIYKTSYIILNVQNKHNNILSSE